MQTASPLIGTRKRACRRGMPISCVVVPTACLPGARGAQLEPVVARSTSGQFVVRGLPQTPLRSGQSTSEVGYLRLDPALTAVSLERIRQSVSAELNLPEKWRGVVTVST